MKIFVTFLTFLIILSACNVSETETVENLENDSSQSVNDLNPVDSLISEMIDTNDLMDLSSDPDVKEAQVEIIKKFGEQWDFCTCIVKSDSVNTALMEASDDDFDKVMERSEYIDSKCKSLLIQPNDTPDERTLHEKRVKKCLSESK